MFEIRFWVDVPMLFTLIGLVATLAYLLSEWVVDMDHTIELHEVDE